ncbi:flagellar basal body P-ring formation chaperone FlgA [uncultured Roseovarius sp.]|uniref:flagellar basal body P-ring formation chaperone FlgA n=1 Tax=uncultured Roseovarius sp. TaxID=293344 RepID=UPI0025E73F94|nr:flagellar basal body P-ring formation chaperone FlgA [uncultured Roseovarius sp.]
MIRLAAFLLTLGVPAMADTVLATRTIRAQSIIGPGDVVVKAVDIPGAATSPEAVIGLEARVSLYAGRPIRMNDVGQPALVERNQVVPLIFEKNGLQITTEGRSLDRAGSGETVRVMNMSSRNTVSGRVLPDGQIMVSR